MCIGLIGSACGCLCQQLGNPLQPGTIAASENTNPPRLENKRIFGIIPNYRTSPTLREFEPLTSRDKFRIATEDAFDRGSFGLAAIFAGEAQLTNSNRSFGQGAAAYAKYYGAAFADFTIGDYMTEAIYPSLLHRCIKTHDISGRVLEAAGRGWATRWARFSGGTITISRSAGTNRMNFESHSEIDLRRNNMSLEYSDIIDGWHFPGRRLLTASPALAKSALAS